MSSSNTDTKNLPSVLSIDPSIATTGYAVLSGDQLLGAGKIETSADKSESYRLWVLYSELVELVEEFQVEHVALEEFTAFYVSRSRQKNQQADGQSPMEALQQKRKGRHDRAVPNPRSMFLMKGAQTAAQFAALQTRTQLYLYPVAEWKGGPRVGKEAIRKKAQSLYGIQTRDHNITDAVMIGHHHLQVFRASAPAGFVAPRKE